MPPPLHSPSKPGTAERYRKDTRTPRLGPGHVRVRLGLGPQVVLIGPRSVHSRDSPQSPVWAGDSGVPEKR